MNIIVLAAGLAFFAGIAWAVRYHFNSNKKPLCFIAITALSVLSIGVFADQLWRKPQPMPRLAITLLLITVASALFVAALRASRAARLKLLFDESMPASLVTAGPYRYIRHPFYASYILYWLGIATATLHPINAGYFAVLVAVVTAGALGEERLFDKSAHAAEYAAYRARAGLFWPKLPGGTES